MSRNDSQPDIIVYHGSTSLIDKIDVTRGKPYKDFGRGFYDMFLGEMGEVLDET